MAMTVTELNELAQKRAGLVGQARALNDLYVKEKSSLTADEAHQIDTMVSDALGIKKLMDNDKVLRDQEAELAEPRDTVAGGKGDVEKNDAVPEPISYRGAVLNNKDTLRRATKEYGKVFRDYLMGVEMRTPYAFANDVDADGGYLHAPIQFVAKLLQAIDAACFVRRYAQVIPLQSSDSIGFPALKTDFADADWTTEIGTITPDETAVLDMREFKPNQITKEIDVSMKLLRTAQLSPETIVMDRLAAIFARTEEKAFLVGAGTTKPLGVFAATGTGCIPTTRDSTTGSTSTALTVDSIRAARWMLRPEYWTGARWLMSTATLAKVSLFKDGEGRYCWQPALAAGTYDLIDGFPVDQSAYAPETFAASDYVGLLANWGRGYLIVDMMDVTIQRLNELMARTSKIGFIARKFTDGGPIDPEAFVRLKLAATG